MKNLNFINKVQARDSGSAWRECFGNFAPDVYLAVQEGRELIQKGWSKAELDQQLRNGIECGGVLKNSSPAALGYQIALDSLTQIRAKTVDQKFYEINPADAVPVQVGFGSFMEYLTTYRTYSASDDFETGIVNEARDSKIARANVAFESIATPIKKWAFAYEYSVFDVNQAMRSGNWSLIEKLERARKKSWDLGIQRTAFLGLKGDTNLKGLLNQSGVTIDTTTIPTSLTAMDQSQFRSFLGNVFKAFVANSIVTSMPDTFVIPLTDWLGLSKPTDDAFSLRSRIDYLIESFQKMTNNPNAKVVPVAYGDKNYNGLGVNRYALYRKDEDVLLMNIPTSYTSVITGTVNGLQFESGAYGQFTGVQLFRPQEIIYFDNTVSI